MSIVTGNHEFQAVHLINFDSINTKDMKKLLSAVLLTVLFQTSGIFAQCPVTSFQVPDSICGGDSVFPVNTSTGAGVLSYYWDFSSGDAKKTPVASNTINLGSTVADALGSYLVYDSTNYYLFILGSTLTRLDFGNSLSNTPTASNLGSLPLLNGAMDIQIVKDGAQWYGLVNCRDNRLVRLAFGTDLTTVPATTQLTLLNNSLNFPYYMTLVHDSSGFFCVTPNLNNSTLTVAAIGATMLNDTAVCNNFPLAPNGFPVGVCAAKDCDQWYVFVTYTGVTDISKLSFGNSLLNTPTLSALSAGQGVYRDIEAFHEGSDWYLIMNSLNGNNLQLIDFGSSLGNNSQTAIQYGDLGQLSGSDYTLAINTNGSDLSFFSTNQNSGNVTHIKFPDSQLAGPVTSTSQSPSFFNAGSGWIHLSLAVTDQYGFTGYFSDSIYTNPAPVPGFTYSTACEGLSILFNDTSTIAAGSVADVQWDFGDTNFGTGDTVSHIYNVAAPYSVIMTVTSDKGCGSAISQMVNVASNPSAQLIFIDNQCQNTGIIFTDGSSTSSGILTDWFWSFGDSTTASGDSISHQFNSAGAFNVQLTVTNSFGCTDSVSDSIHVEPAPSANFSVFNTCLNEQTQFINLSDIPSGLSATYSWSFGNGDSSTAVSPVESYAPVIASYDVTLIIAVNNGCNDTTSINITTGNKPAPAFTFTPDTACAGNAVTFTDNSLPASGDTIIHRYWSFGDGTYDSTSVNPVHQYANAGSYTITLTAVSPTYCDSSVTAQIFVIESPVAEFTATDTCFGFATTFTDLSTPPPGSSITTWNWNFGDSSTDTIQNPVYNYSVHGTYQVALTVVNSFGCSNTVNHFVPVYELPVADFTSGKACTDLPVLFNDSSQADSSVINVWQWSFGDNTTDSVMNTQHIYNQSGVYPVQLIVVTNHACVDTITKNILVNQTPVVSTTVSGTCPGLPNTFQTTVAGPLTNYGFQWNFGDNTFALLPNPVHLYASSGDYPASVTVVDLLNGCSIQVPDTAHVFPLPDASFISDSACIGDVLNFSDSTSITSGAISNWAWDFGSYGTSNVQNPTLLVAQADSFITKLTVTSDHGCKDSVTATAFVYPLPLATFTPSVTYGAPPLDVGFTMNAAGNSAEWDFGDGATSFLTNPHHIYNDTGQYVVTLTAISPFGCSNQSTKIISVLIPVLDLSVENISFVQINNEWEMRCRLRNLGNIDITSFSIQAQLEGKSLVTENVSADTLSAGQAMNFVFATRFVVDNNTPEFFCTEILQVNNTADDNVNNNQKCTSPGNEFHVFEVYPNPSHSESGINLNIPEDGFVSMNMYDLRGRQVKPSTEVTLPKGYQQLPVNLQGLQNGIYLLDIRYGDFKVTRSFIKW